MARSLALCIVLVASLFGSVMADDNWPQWRGPLGTGVAADGDYPVKFSADENLAWKVELPGLGSSTPAVWGDRIFVTCSIGGQDAVVCYGMDGDERWRKTLGKARAGKHANGSGSNPSPVTDGKRIVVYYKSGNVGCFDLDGKQLWTTNVQDRYGEDTLWWDLGTSPVLLGDRVILAVMHGGDSYLAAFDAKSGDEVWKTDRNYKTAEESDHAYTTPQVVQSNGKDVIVTWGADHLTGHDAKNGELLWESAGFNVTNEGNWRTISSAAVENGIAIVSYGRGKFLAGVRLEGSGDITKSGRIWEHSKFGTDVPTPVVRDGKGLLLDDRGKIVYFDLKSGEELWSADLPRNRNKYYASPVLAGDKLYCAREDGVIFAGQQTEKGFEQLAENDMGEKVIATVVPVQDSLLIRGEKHLFRVGAATVKTASAANNN
jgi:outer membrane protein assembly factor BamB